MERIDEGFTLVGPQQLRIGEPLGGRRDRPHRNGPDNERAGQGATTYFINTDHDAVCGQCITLEGEQVGSHGVMVPSPS